MPRSLARILVLSAVAAATCGSNVREDEFLCEEAHARLEECCPGFSVETSWCTWEGGCDSAGYSPALAVEESRCIARTSCASLRANGVCERAAARERPSTTTLGDAGSAVTEWEPVCR